MAPVVARAPLSGHAPSVRGRARAQTSNLALATFAFAVCFTAWGLIAPLAKRFEDDLHLSSLETSLLIAVPVVLGALARLPVGMLTDRWGGRRMFAAVLAASALPVFLLGYAESYWSLLLVGLLLGVAGSSFAVGVPFAAGWYGKERQGFALGVYGMGNIGTAVAAFSAPAIVDAWGRPALGWGASVLLLATAAVFALAARDAPRTAAPARYREVARAGWRLYRLALLYFVTFGGFVAMAIYLPKLLRDWFDLSLVDAGIRAAVFTIAATLARPAGGWLADRLEAYPVLVLAFAGVTADAAVLAALAPNPRVVPVTIACLTLAVFLGAGSGAVFKLVPHEFPDDVGAATGIVGAAGGLGGFFPPIVMGLVNDTLGSYALGFVGLLLFSAGCLLLSVWMLRTAPIARLPEIPRGGALA